MNTTGERIKYRRKELGMTADVLAEALGINRSTIFRYERGDIEKLPAILLADIAKALHVSPGYLMGWEDAPAAAPAADPLHKKIDRLDDVDKIRTEAYVDGLLSADKYQKNTSAGTA